MEQLYADFGYPAAVSKFVRYMPVAPGMLVGLDRLFDRWARYLADEATELAEGPLQL